MNTATRSSALRTQVGFSLIELMISLVLGLVLIGGVISVFLSNQQSYRTNQALSQLQDNARTAFEMMARDIRQAGSSPCGNASVTNSLASLNGANNDTYIWANNPIQGFDDATTLTGPALPGAVNQSAIVTQGVGSISTPNIQAGASCATGAPFTSAPTDITAGDLVLACDVSQAYIYQTSGFAGGALKLATTGLPGNSSTNLACSTFGQSAYVAPYQAHYWYIAPAGAGAPAGALSLYRARFAAGLFVSDEIIRGVRDMTLSYHRANATGFVDAATVGTAWATVDAVQITLILRNTDQRVGSSSDSQAAPLERTFTTTVGLRK